MNNLNNFGITVADNKALRMWKRQKGKPYLDQIDEQGNTNLEVFTKYLEWAGLNPTEVITTINEKNNTNMYVWVERLANLTDDDVGVKQFVCSNRIEAITYISKVVPSEVVDTLPLVEYERYLAIKPSNEDEAQDIKRTWLIKKLCANHWHVFNNKRVEESRRIAQEAEDLELDRQYDEDVACGNIVVTTLTEGLSRREAEAAQAVVDSLEGKCPTNLLPFYTPTVKARIAQLESELIEKRMKHKAEVEAKAKLGMFNIRVEAFEGITCPLRVSQVKREVLKHLNEVKALAGASVRTYFDVQCMIDPVSSTLAKDVLNLAQGVVDYAIEIVNYKGDLLDDPMFNYNEERMIAEYVLNFDNYQITNGMMNKVEKEIADHIHFVSNVRTPSHYTMSDVRSKIEDLVRVQAWELSSGEIEVSLRLPEYGVKSFFYNSAYDAVKGIDQLLEEHPEAKVKKGDVIDKEESELGKLMVHER